MRRTSLESPAFYLNREASWLAFNRRVLEEAEDEQNPTLERLKFLSITASNLDEFFEVRVASLLQHLEDGHMEGGPDGLTLAEERDLIAGETHRFVDDQYRCWNERLRPALAGQGVGVLGMHELNGRAKDFVEEYCRREVDPLLTPITVDPAHPFPRVINKALCIALLLKRRRRSGLVYTGVVTVPRALPRLIRLPSADTHDYIFLADLVTNHATQMYRGYEILSSAAFRVTRNSNLYLQEEESRSLLESVRTELHNRRKGAAVRLEIDADADPEIAERLRTNFGLEPYQVFHTQGPVNLHRLFSLYEQVERPDLKYKPFVARELHLTAKSNDLFDEVRQRDILLHHPYDSFESVVSLIESAVSDPRVVSIKQTLYRTSQHSLIVPALIAAAAARKEVTVVVELKARFDEASNIGWARDLEDAGVQVFHGVVGLKTHCKLALVVRHDPDGITRRYVHLGTGNYNVTTARLYTDLSLLTADEQITGAVHNVFTYLTAYTEHSRYDPLVVAPINLVERCLELIEREAEHARHGRPARIIAKMNGLLDKTIIAALYRASQAGVGIDLIVRGMCALRPGVRGVSDRIRVRSVVGRLLEHSRIFFFANGGEEEIYVGSADWMPRNLYERVEVLFPVQDPVLHHRLRGEILEAYLADDVKARVLRSDGTYVRAWQTGCAGRKPLSPSFNAQQFLIEVAEGKRTEKDIPEPRSASKKLQPKLLLQA